MSESVAVEGLRFSVFGGDWLLEGLKGKGPDRVQRPSESAEPASR
jgi:hypothetical protein